MIKLQEKWEKISRNVLATVHFQHVSTLEKEAWIRCRERDLAKGDLTDSAKFVYICNILYSSNAQVVQRGCRVEGT